jgi:hypothetical protein
MPPHQGLDVGEALIEAGLIVTVGLDPDEIVYIGKHGGLMGFGRAEQSKHRWSPSRGVAMI